VADFVNGCTQDVRQVQRTDQFPMVGVVEVHVAADIAMGLASERREKRNRLEHAGAVDVPLPEADISKLAVRVILRECRSAGVVNLHKMQGRDLRPHGKRLLDRRADLLLADRVLRGVEQPPAQQVAVTVRERDRFSGRCLRPTSPR